MAKKNFYAVKIGRVPGIYTTWDECKAQVSEFSGAQYKGFATLEEAEAFIAGDNVNSIEKKLVEDSTNNVENGVKLVKNATKSANSNVKNAIEFSEESCSLANESGVKRAIAYVDGSYDSLTKRFSCGVILLYDGNEVELSQAFDDESLAVHRNVSGEIMGACTAIEYCIENGIKAVDIYYDYTGIQCWGDGVWKANTVITQAYKEYVAASREVLNIRFIKVKGHSGDKYNDIADKLAKDALK